MQIHSKNFRIEKLRETRINKVNLVKRVLEIGFIFFLLLQHIRPCCITGHSLTYRFVIAVLITLIVTENFPRVVK